MKRNNIFKLFAMAAVLVASLSSCNDFLTIYPTDKTIGEDFWKTKEDVKGIMTGVRRGPSFGVPIALMNWLSIRITIVLIWKTSVL